MNAEMIDELTRVDSREADIFLEEIDAIMREEMERLERKEQERRRMNVLLDAFRL